MTDSLPLLWLAYAILSLVVLGAGYFAIGFLPRRIRWPLVGLVAGLLWTPWYYAIPATTDDPGFGGFAPAVMITALDLLNRGPGSALLVLSIGALVGAAVGVLISIRRTPPRAGGRRPGHRTAREAYDGRGARQEPSV
ncbi:hypothetical protein [Halotalea alkalilenta]|uniref:hypothetical protein n=1 Tax=Halotalea alkalilenta TaxID=376489 RepID=UPI0006939005|nr:hypothetical protein [Halotalea alkalilenta]